MENSSHIAWLSPFITKMAHHVQPLGFPPLPPINRMSLAERLPAWLFYLPAAFYWLALSLYYRCFTLPCLANPQILLGGFSNESKAELLDSFTCKDYLPRYRLITCNQFLSKKFLHEQMRDARLSFPIIVKPDIGCRGAGVQLVNDIDSLYHYASCYRLGEQFLLNEFVEWAEEIGVFYVKIPGEARGFIPSLTLKYPFLIVGDGTKSIEEHLTDNRAASRLLPLCRKRYGDLLSEKLPANMLFRPTILGSHSAGAIFRDGQNFIDDALQKRMDILAEAMPDFHFGRFDIKCRSLEDFKRGENFKIIEINGTGAEMTHIWDPDGKLLDAWKTLFQQIALLFKIGHQIRITGKTPPSIFTFLRNSFAEIRRKKYYPLSS